jgi:hypothetical protein
LICWLAALVLHSHCNPADYPRRIDFSGYKWTVKTSRGRVGPGPNYFSDSQDNVRVDGDGLHLSIARQGEPWTCAEVILGRSLGYGTYRFYLSTPVDNQDPNVVLGLFTWSSDVADHHREMDIEFGRGAEPPDRNALYAVQPATNPANFLGWRIPPGLTQTIHSFAWRPGNVRFSSVQGRSPDGMPFQERAFTNDIPSPGGEHVRINLWLKQGNAPRNGRPVEIVISKFEFAPAGPTGSR